MREKLEIRNKEYTIKVAANKIAGMRTKETISRAARVFREGKIGTAVARGEVDFQELIKTAESNLNLGLTYNYILPENRIYYKDFTESYPVLGMDDVINLSKEILRALTERYDGFTFSHNISSEVTSTLLENNRGLSLYENHQIFSCSLLFKEKGGANVIDGYVYYFTSASPDLTDFYSYTEDFFNAYSKKVEIEGGDYPVIFAELEPQEMILEFFKETLNGKRYYEGSSLLSGRLGERLFSESLTLFDSCLLPEYGYIRPFDLEGVIRETPDLVLIDNGRLSQVVLDISNATKFRKTTTGNAFRGYKDNPHIDFNLLRLKPGEKLLREIVNGKRVIVPIIASGGSYTDKGDFATPVQLAFVYEDGRLIGRAPQLEISGSFLRLFHEGLLGVSKDKFVSYYPTTPFVLNMGVRVLD